MRSTHTCYCLLLTALPLLAQTPSDGRPEFQAEAWAGITIDTFAAEELRRYLNPDASGKLHERAVFGFDFEYRLSRPLWVWGATSHGVRSAELDCGLAPGLPACDSALRMPPAGPVAREALYMLRNATTLEAALGLRYEFLALQRDSGTPAKAYLKAQAGFASVAGGGSDVADMHDLALGVIATKGVFCGSYIDAGWGRSDVFRTHRRGRAKVEGRLERSVSSAGGPLSFFVQMAVDTDLRTGSDAVQTSLGFRFDIGRIWTSQ